jgi:tetratricopeptide (TPR) repeat protein
MLTDRLNACLRLALVVILAAGLAACAKEVRKPVGQMDTPEHHLLMGLDLVDQDNLAAADKEFDLALQLNPKYGPAKAAKGLVTALKPDGDLDKALDQVDDGLSDAANDTEELTCLVLQIRTYTALARRGLVPADDLVDESEDAFEDGLKLDARSQALHFFQGEAYLQALDFAKAEPMYAKAKELGGKYTERADARWELMQKATRAAPGSLIGKKIVLVDRITRADMAGLLVEELNVRRFYDKTQAPVASTFAPPPAPSQMVEKDEVRKAVDIKGHPLRNDIELVIDLGVAGLEVNPDRTFTPDKPLTKAEVAFIFQDVIIRAKGDEALTTKFIGSESPFPDVRSDHPYFNAVMVCSTRGLVKADPATGLYHPADPVSGVDALLYIKELKTVLNPF